MTLEQQVCSLELAKKLKALNVKQESLFWWSMHGRETTPKDEYQVFFQSVVTEINRQEVPYYSAFTVAELIDLLPWSVSVEAHDKTPYYFEINKSRDTYHCGYHELDTQRALTSQQNDKLADCLALQLIYLIENNLVTV